MNCLPVVIQFEWNLNGDNKLFFNEGQFSVNNAFVELGGGVGDVSCWCCDWAYVEFGFR